MLHFDKYVFFVLIFVRFISLILLLFIFLVVIDGNFKILRKRCIYRSEIGFCMESPKESSYYCKDHHKAHNEQCMKNYEEFYEGYYLNILYSNTIYLIYINFLFRFFGYHY